MSMRSSKRSWTPPEKSVRRCRNEKSWARQEKERVASANLAVESAVTAGVPRGRVRKGPCSGALLFGRARQFGSDQGDNQVAAGPPRQGCRKRHRDSCGVPPQRHGQRCRVETGFFALA